MEGVWVLGQIPVPPICSPCLAISPWDTQLNYVAYLAAQLLWIVYATLGRSFPLFSVPLTSSVFSSLNFPVFVLLTSSAT